MPSTWLTVISWVSLAIAVACALAIVADMYGGGRRQSMWIMEIVWPVTALYLGPIALWAYLRRGRAGEERNASADERVDDAWGTALAVSHCGAGCTLGDIVGAWIVFAVGLELLGLALPAEYVVDFALAFSLGIAFQYFSIVPMRGLGVREGLVAAVKADSLSLAAFEVGLFGWMALIQLVFYPGPHLHPDHAAYWFLMQVGMILGFLTALPVNRWLIRRGLKERM